MYSLFEAEFLFYVPPPPTLPVITVTSSSNKRWYLGVWLPPVGWLFAPIMLDVGESCGVVDLSTATVYEARSPRPISPPPSLASRRRFSDEQKRKYLSAKCNVHSFL